MTKHSIVIELSSEDDNTLYLPAVERWFAEALKPVLERNGLTIVHLEAAKGSLLEAFGVGLKK